MGQHFYHPPSYWIQDLKGGGFDAMGWGGKYIYHLSFVIKVVNNL